MNLIRALSLLIVGFTSFSVFPACAQTPYNTPSPVEKDRTLETDIVAVMNSVRADWNAQNYDALARHWDTLDAHPIYLAEESDAVMTSWPQIEAYWAATESWVDWIVVDYLNYDVKQIDETNAMVTFDLRFDLKLNDRANPIGGDNRGVVSLRKVEGEWKIHAWVEAPLSAATYIRKLYEMNVREDLPVAAQ